jgi:predicted secreted protein
VSDNLKDILSSLSTDIDQETLLKYLNGQLSEEKKHEVEKYLVDNEFDDEALEGLQQFKSQQDIQFFTEQLNRDLKKKLEKKNVRREKLKLKDQSWLYLTVIILLLLIILAYIVVRKLQAE